MDVFNLAARLTLDSSDYDKGLSKASDSAGNFGSSLKSGLATAGKVAGAAIGAASAAVGKIAKEAVDGYADYEQLTGGIETLFGAGGKSLEEYAETAKATARDIENSGIDWSKYADTAWMEGGGISGLFEEMQYNFEDIKTSAEELQEYLYFEYDLDIEDAQKAIEAYQKASDSGKIQKDYESLMAVQDMMMSNAAQAYKTAGMSANEYMEMAIQSGASMISSVGGDTAKAAEYMDLAITDMSDNVNKMGTTMESVQNAYRGFSKGNFTMLDNLALGYGGTKEEMGRLLEEAEKLAGLDPFTFDINSYSDIVQAIHIVQENLGITGTTAKEASETISGSTASMKAAWQNLLVGMADPAADLSGLIGNVVGAAETAFGNILPVAEQAITGIATFVEEVAPIIAEKLPGIVETVLPSVLNAATSLVTALVDALPTIMEVLIEQGPVIINTLLAKILEMLPEIVALGLTLLTSLAMGIADNLDELIPTIVDVVLQIVETITDPETLSNLVDAALAIIIALTEGIIASIPELLKRAPEIITNLVTTLVENLPKIFDAGADILLEVIKGILSALPDLVAAIPELILAVVTGLANGVKDLFGAGEKVLGDVKDGFFSKLGDAANWGKDLISNFVDGITSKWDELKSGVKGVAQTVKDFLGFSEPKEGPLSNFHTYAPDMMELFAKGIRDNEHLITDQISDSFDIQAGINGRIGTGSAAPMTIIVQSVLDGRVIGETAYRYGQGRLRAVGG